MEAQVAAVQSEGIVTVGAVDVTRLVERLAEVSADEVFVAELRTECRLAQCPLDMAVEVKAEHVGAVVVVRHPLLTATEQLEAVLVPVPVDGRTEVEGSALGLGLYGGEDLAGVFKLVVVFRAVERV